MASGVSSRDWHGKKKKRRKRRHGPRHEAQGTRLESRGSMPPKPGREDPHSKQQNGKETLRTVEKSGAGLRLAATSQWGLPRTGENPCASHGTWQSTGTMLEAQAMGRGDDESTRRAWRQKQVLVLGWQYLVVNTECNRWERRPKDSWSSSSGRRGRRGRAGWLGSVSFLANEFVLGRSRRNTCTNY